MTHNNVPPADQSRFLAEASVPRQGWEEQYQRMAENGDDALLDGDIPLMTKWDDMEWDW